MSDEEILNALLTISQAIADDEDKYKILNYINVIANKIEKKQDKASNYIDSLLKDLN